MRPQWLTTLLLAALFAAHAMNAAAAEVRVGDATYATIQQALDANPGRMIFLPDGDYTVSSAIRITHDGSGLYGGARIISSNPDEDIIYIEGAADVAIRDLTLTRAPGTEDVNRRAAVWAEGCTRVEYSRLHVLENRSPRGALYMRECTQSRIDGCVVHNYKRLAIDDRTDNAELYGYAFQAIDGHGIQAHECRGLQITGNRVIESRFRPTREIHDRHKLGTLTVKPEQPGRLMPRDIFDSGYTNNWHQGSGLQVSSPRESDQIIIRGNYFENAAQGMDVHADHVVIAGNIVHRAMIGMKAMHGAKHVLISGNQFNYCDLWGLLLMPGSASHTARAASADEPAREDNSDGGTIVANNIFSHFGMGDQYWNWETRDDVEYPERNVIALLFGQIEENPPLRDVVVSGNVVYDSGRDGALVEGHPRTLAPRYFYAVYVETARQPAPERIRIGDNLLDPGMSGVSNVALIP